VAHAASGFRVCGCCPDHLARLLARARSNLRSLAGDERFGASLDELFNVNGGRGYAISGGRSCDQYDKRALSIPSRDYRRFGIREAPQRVIRPYKRACLAVHTESRANQSRTRWLFQRTVATQVKLFADLALVGRGASQ